MTMSLTEMEWIGAVKCSLCGKREPEGIIYGATITGEWAVMCERCYRTHGVGLGAGRGRRYERQQRDGKYVKVEG
jgi:hypothetical protein